MTRADLYDRGFIVSTVYLYDFTTTVEHLPVVKSTESWTKIDAIDWLFHQATKCFLLNCVRSTKDHNKLKLFEYKCE